MPTDITEDVLRGEFLPTGWVDNKVCAIDETWSDLRFALRRELRQRLGQSPSTMNNVESAYSWRIALTGA